MTAFENFKKMSEQEVFYDSLEEDGSESDEYYSSRNSKEIVEDNYAETVPLYSGDAPRKKIWKMNKKHTEKTIPVFRYPYEKNKKSYLSIYYDKISRLKSDGSNTTRAVCDNLTPRREEIVDISPRSAGTDTEVDLEERFDGLSLPPLHSPFNMSFRFYEKFLKSEMQNKKDSLSTSSLSSSKRNTNRRTSSQFTSKSSLTLKSPFYVAPCRSVQEDKMELLKKRQNYGMMMTRKNKIRVEELKALQKVKDLNMGRLKV